jgi:hypothetical protein
VRPKLTVTTDIMAVYAAGLAESFTTQVLRHLSDHGSNIRVLDVGQYSFDYLNAASYKDKDGQEYPYYNYTKCRTQDALRNIRVVAMPVPFRGYPRPEFAGTKMFCHRMVAWLIIPWDEEDFVAT